jgi:hypothetical protein
MEDQVGGLKGRGEEIADVFVGAERGAALDPQKADGADALGELAEIVHVSLQHHRRIIGRQCEGEGAALSGRADDANLAEIQGDEIAGDVQSEAESLGGAVLGFTDLPESLE